MTKQVNTKNQIWFEQTEQGVTRIGFTRSFLDGMDQCWHILPANREKFRAKSPLMVVETNDELVSILSPIAGNFAQWNAKAQNFPNQLTEDDVILELSQGRVIQPEQEEVAPQRAVGGLFAQMAAQAPVPPMHWEDQMEAAQLEVRNRLMGRANPAAPQPAAPRNVRGRF